MLGSQVWEELLEPGQVPQGAQQQLGTGRAGGARLIQKAPLSAADICAQHPIPMCRDWNWAPREVSDDPAGRPEREAWGRRRKKKARFCHASPQTGPPKSRASLSSWASPALEWAGPPPSLSPDCHSRHSPQSSPPNPASSPSLNCHSGSLGRSRGRRNEPHQPPILVPFRSLKRGGYGLH